MITPRPLLVIVAVVVAVSGACPAPDDDASDAGPDFQASIAGAMYGTELIGELHSQIFEDVSLSTAQEAAPVLIIGTGVDECGNPAGTRVSVELASLEPGTTPCRPILVNCNGGEQDPLYVNADQDTGSCTVELSDESSLTGSFTALFGDSPVEGIFRSPRCATAANVSTCDGL